MLHYGRDAMLRNRKNIFGKINENCVGAAGRPPVIKNCWPDNNIKLNEFGLIVHEELKNTESIQNEIKLDQYVIMPNHSHCIIIMNRAASQPPLRTTSNIINRK